MENIKEDAQKLADQYSFLTLKSFFHDAIAEGITDYERAVVKEALNIHRKIIREKINENKSL